MTDDELISRACGVPIPRYSCGHVKGFTMGFGYSDPRAKCEACRARELRNGCLVRVAFLVALFGALCWLGR